MKANKSDNNLIWVDLEMTGLDPEKEKIIEIATIITDSDLNIIAEGPNIAIHQSNELLDKMDEWNVNQHTSSGLMDAVKTSIISDKEAELETLDFISKYVPAGKSPMCGNTVSHDRRFLSKYMPQLEAYFNYRHIDVSSVKEVITRWSNNAQAYEKNSCHRAQDDIRESINELRFYKKEFFRI